MESPLLSVVMPVYNERETIDEIVSRVLAIPMRVELVVVEDCSTDGTRARLEELQKEELNRVWVLRKVLTPLSPSEAMELLLSKMGKTKTNGEFLSAMASGKS